MNIKIIASGSSGNCYLLESRGVKILLDCGIPFGKIQRAMNYELPDAVFVTHEHQDHIKAANDLLARGVEVFMTRGTAKEGGIIPRHNLTMIDTDALYNVKGITVTPFAVIHDAAEPVCFKLSDIEDRVLYLTDCGVVPDRAINDSYTKIMVEANYDEYDLCSKPKVTWLDGRIYTNHLSFKQALALTQRLSTEALSEVYLIHISSRNGDADFFKRRTQKVTHARVYTPRDGK